MVEISITKANNRWDQYYCTV